MDRPSQGQAYTLRAGLPLPRHAPNLRETKGSNRTFWDLWTATEDYVRSFDEYTYTDDTAVSAHADLQAWLRESRDPNEGIIRGLPTMDSRDALVRPA